MLQNVHSQPLQYMGLNLRGDTRAQGENDVGAQNDS